MRDQGIQPSRNRSSDTLVSADGLSRSVNIGGDANAAGCKQTKSSPMMRTKCTLQGLQDTTAFLSHTHHLARSTHVDHHKKNNNEADGKAKPVNQPQSRARRDKSSTPIVRHGTDCCEADCSRDEQLGMAVGPLHSEDQNCQRQHAHVGSAGWDMEEEEEEEEDNAVRYYGSWTSSGSHVKARRKRSRERTRVRVHHAVRHRVADMCW